MKVLLQRVESASVKVEGETVSRIGRGLLLYAAIEKGDAAQGVEKMAEKITRYRIFYDEAGKMNLSVSDVKGEILAVSQFTLAALTAKGNRPGFEPAEEPVRAKQLFDLFVSRLSALIPVVQTGVFAAHMQVESVNDGPVTFLLSDSKD